MSGFRKIWSIVSDVLSPTKQPATPPRSAAVPVGTGTHLEPATNSYTARVSRADPEDVTRLLRASAILSPLTPDQQQRMHHDEAHPIVLVLPDLEPFPELTQQPKCTPSDSRNIGGNPGLDFNWNFHKLFNSFLASPEPLSLLPQTQKSPAAQLRRNCNFRTCFGDWSHFQP